MRHLVGPVLEASSIGQTVVGVIRQNNPGVTVEDRGAYLRVLAPERCHLDRRAVEEAVGGTFRLPGDLEAIMPSFKGLMTLTANEAVWTAPKPREGSS
jgi:toluene monooxygenase system protein D